MIAAISAWIKNIILVVLFASFMELLLPSSSMQRFIRVIMGLFIMLAILNPVLDVIHNHLTSQQELSLVTTKLNNVGNANNITNSMAEERDKLSYDLYKKELAKQIKAIVSTIDGVADARVAVEVNSGKDSSLAGSIKHVTVYVQPGIAAMGRKVSPVSKITVSENDDTKEFKELKPQLINKIQTTVAELYQLPRNQIEVKLLY